jgi:hypothetical protein
MVSGMPATHTPSTHTPSTLLGHVPGGGPRGHEVRGGPGGDRADEVCRCHVHLTGTFSPDGDPNTGRWQWPDGSGSYTATMTCSN